MLSNPQTEENIIPKKEPDIAKVISRSAVEAVPYVSRPLDNDDDEESQLRAKIERMAVHQKKIEKKGRKCRTLKKKWKDG